MPRRRLQLILPPKRDPKLDLAWTLLVLALCILAFVAIWMLVGGLGGP